jgi:very-short-patch-repair endonuclease
MRTMAERRELARQMRANPTPAEGALWPWLAGQRLGARFIRQEPLGSAIVDFYAPEARLVVELDGEVHDSDRARSYDRRRDLRVLHFRNQLVVYKLPEVVAKIRAAVGKLRGFVRETPDAFAPARNAPHGPDLRDEDGNPT